MSFKFRLNINSKNKNKLDKYKTWLCSKITLFNYKRLKYIDNMRYYC